MEIQGFEVAVGVGAGGGGPGPAGGRPKDWGSIQDPWHTPQGVPARNSQSLQAAC